MLLSVTRDGGACRWKDRLLLQKQLILLLTRLNTIDVRKNCFHLNQLMHEF